MKSRHRALAAVTVAFAASQAPLAAGADEAWSLTVEGGRKGALQPAAHPAGTRVEVVPEVRE